MTAVDANLSEHDVEKLRWYAQREDRSLAAQVRYIVREWIKTEEAAGEFRGFHRPQLGRNAQVILAHTQSKDTN